MTGAKNIRIFVASPGDVEMEREQLASVVSSLNSTISAVAPEKNITLELVRWETHTYPGVSADGAQGVVWKQLGDIGEFDIFIGIMWKRFGTPTKHALSGSEEEFEAAYAALMTGIKKLRDVMFYFCQEKISVPQTDDEVTQLRRVVQFRERLSQRGLTGQYDDRQKFAEVVKSHLDRALSGIVSERDDVKRAAERVGLVQIESTGVRQQVMSLARDYVRTRQEPFSGERTQKLEAVFTKLRSLAFLAYPMLPELTSSVPQGGDKDQHAGERLAAIAFLEAIPNEDYLDWLSERIGLEQPFVEYHSALALLSAARAFKKSNREVLRDLIKSAQTKVPKDTDRFNVLSSAIAELEP